MTVAQLCIAGEASFAPALAAAKARGIGGLECVVDGERGVGVERSDWIAEARRRGFTITGLVAVDYPAHHLGCAEGAFKGALLNRTVNLMELAVRLSARTVSIVPTAHPNRTAAIEDFSYEQAHYNLYAVLLELAVEAEKRGVVLAIEGAVDGFLTSPLELRELIDRVHSPYVGVCLREREVGRYGSLPDWIRCLGFRLRRVWLPYDPAVLSGAGAAGGSGATGSPWRAALRALEDVRYEGAVVIEDGSEDNVSTART